jgi:para-aminobenzoate synthetase component 1
MPVTVVRALDLSPDPLAVARALAGRPGLAVLASRPAAAPRPDDARHSFVACDPVDATDDLLPPEGDGSEEQAPAWIGVIPYEALRGIERPAWTRNPDDRAPCPVSRPAWRRYAAVVRIDHATARVDVVGDDERSVDRLARLSTRAPYPQEPSAVGGLRVLPDDEPPAAHLERVREALRLIAAGDLYEVNLARRIPVAFQGDGLALFRSLLDAAPAPWGFFQDLGEVIAIATSPELALSVRGETMRTCPIKGTRPRGEGADEDARLARELDADPKERAELTMAVDVHRNDLGRVAVPGSVRVLGEPRVLGGRTVWSRVAEVVARRAPGATLQDIARAVLPCGSVTGAPKVRAMEVIARLEPWRRGLYTGVFGYVGRGGQLELAMAIRTLQLSRAAGGGDYFAGGGIVADSIPERELAETRWKATQLEQLAGT